MNLLTTTAIAFLILLVAVKCRVRLGRINYKCPNVKIGKFINPKNCISYIYCDKGRARKIPCAKHGSIQYEFSPKSLHCLPPHEANCGKKAHIINNNHNRFNEEDRLRKEIFQNNRDVLFDFESVNSKSELPAHCEMFRKLINDSPKSDLPRIEAPFYKRNDDDEFDHRLMHVPKDYNNDINERKYAESTQKPETSSKSTQLPETSSKSTQLPETSSKSTQLPETSSKSTQLPKSLDWREKGYVSFVKDQGQCGSSVAFSVSGAIESTNAVKKGLFTQLSFQEVINCCSKNCKGGMIADIFGCIIDMHGLGIDSCYSNIPCSYNKSCKPVVVNGFTTIGNGFELGLQEAVAKSGPVVATIDAKSVQFRNYSAGIYDNPNCSSTDLDHSVLVIGYGEEKGQDYWLVQNSWGTSWGLKGYIKMSRNKNNQCGIASNAYYPTL